MGKYQELEELEVYQLAVALADRIWEIVSSWSSFARDTLGKQMVRAADSIAANIAESYGRYHYGDKLNFLYYSRGSLYETKHWVRRSRSRGLMSDATFDDLFQEKQDYVPLIRPRPRRHREQPARF